MYSLTKLMSSETSEDFFAEQSYVAHMELNARIYKARSDAKLTQQELADATGKTRGAVAQWESGEVRPRHSTLVAIAKATGKPIEWIENGIGDEVSGLMVVGEVAAGTWKEGSVEYRQIGMPVSPHPRYPAHAQRLYQVAGTSLNRIVPDGEYIHTVSVHEAGIRAEPGDLVVVRRMQHGLTEYTAKRYVIEEGRRLLRPESDDPQWQDPLEVNGDDGSQIEITDVIIAKWSPIGRLG